MDFYVLTRWFNCSKPAEQFDMSKLNEVADEEEAWEVIEQEFDGSMNQVWLLNREELDRLVEVIDNVKDLPEGVLL